MRGWHFVFGSRLSRETSYRMQVLAPMAEGRVQIIYHFIFLGWKTGSLGILGLWKLWSPHDQHLGGRSVLAEGE